VLEGADSGGVAV